MLRLQPYIAGTHDVVGAFSSIFDESELPFLNKIQISSPSYVGLDRRGLIQAFILTQKTPEAHTNCEIAYVGVMPRYRRKGYAERLIRMVIDAADESGVWLQVMRDNAAACRLYEKMGFDCSEEFVGSTGSAGYIWLYGVEYECEDCSVRLKPSATTWENREDHLLLGPYGIERVMKLAPVCNACRTRTEK